MKQRIEKIQNFLKQDEAALVYDGSSRFYLTGFSSSAGVVVITQKCAVLFVDFRYIEKAKQVVSNMEVRLLTNQNKQIGEVFENEKIKKVFIQPLKMSVEKYNDLSNAFKEIEILKTGDFGKFLDQLRAIKSEREIGLIKSAQELTDTAFQHILNYIMPGKTEKEIALELEFFMRKNGAEAVAFDTIAVSGKNSSLPHGVPTEKPLEKGDFLTMDFGAKLGGYCSDMTRTVAISGITPKQKEVYNIVLKAQQMALESIKEGKICKDIDAVARNYINQSGFEDCFGHGLGHSVGIDIHESPSFNTKDITVLKDGMVLTVEPGIYIENEFGVRIEDMIVVTQNGCNNLTKSPKELIII
ncbi:MAG: aminopeptidase P family protein [Ruminococcaceae bacterium]|nr:aminopeptidase P family protein [Oscillospiraceae bacterium]